jgi:hypothetical protein
LRSHTEQLEYRRLKYAKQNRQLTLQEIERWNYFRATYQLEPRSQIGYDFEIKEVLPQLREVGFGDYIFFNNPEHPFDWKQNEGKGVDLIMEIRGHKLFVEETKHTKYYQRYQKDWMKDRLSRFRDCPKPTEKILWIILTNRPENFTPKPVQRMAEENSVKIMNVEELLSLIDSLSKTLKIL